MIIKFDIENDQYLEIEDLIKKGKYQDVIQFIKLSISNQLQEEKNQGIVNNKDSDRIPEKVFADITPDQIAAFVKNSEGIRNRLLQNVKHIEGLIITDDSDNKKTNVDFIWSFYNRFFPVKLAVVKLAQLITPEKPYCNLDEWREVATEAGQEYEKILGEFEIEIGYRRNQRMTIGLPTHYSILDGIKRKGARKRIEDKLSSSKNRFANQFVGRYNRKKNTLEGAPFLMDLISFKISGDECLISLTNLGKEFASLRNPLLNEDYSKIFSNDEVEIIYKKIIPQFKIEKQIIEIIINDLKNKKLTAEQCQSIFSDYEELILKFSLDKPEKLGIEGIKKKITEARIGTMGRLSELKIIDWEFINGKSHYSLNKEKMNLLGL